MPARVLAPHRGQACARAKFLRQTTALMGFCLEAAVIPLPPHQFLLWADEVVQRETGRVLTDRQWCGGLGGNSCCRHVAALTLLGRFLAGDNV